MKRVAILTLLVGLVALPLAAQTVPTGTLTGHVTDGKEPLPAVTVTISSPAMQGARTAVTQTSGDYIFRFVPPGEYRVRFELQGFQTLDTSIRISAAQEAKLDAEMPAAKVAEEVTVVGSYETISATATSATTYESKLVNNLPTGRDIVNYVALAPGTSATGPNNATVIAGAMSFENLYLVNGVTIGENLRGQVTPVYIEDAIQETTTSVSNVSAEYGRFTGGVVNTLTRSGGNEFHGSLRLNLSNPMWTAPTPKTTGRADVLGKIWEATLGGYVFTDKLWFFLAGRDTTTDVQNQLYTPVNEPFTTTTKETRYEGKLTWSINPDHRIIGSYASRSRDWTNYWFTSYQIYDFASTYPRSIPEDLYSVNYTGVLSNSFFIEGQYSARHLTFINSGGRYTDFIKGTPVYDPNNPAIYNSPIFCAVCEKSREKRDNEDYLAKASWFLSTQKTGSHDLRLGVDVYSDLRTANNYQSGSSYFINPEDLLIAGSGLDAKFYPVLTGGGAVAYIRWWPIFTLSKGNNFQTQSAFINDVWRLNNNWSFNIGVRYDKNHGVDASGTKVVNDSKFSPRISATWDPRADGDMNISLGYGEYVAAVANTIADSQASGGQPAFYDVFYGGPDINTTCDPATGTNCTETPAALQIIKDWLDSLPGGILGNSELWGPYSPSVPGYDTFIGNLVSPSTNEWALSFNKRLGTRGLFRFDYINRKWTNFYEDVLNMNTGTSEDPLGNVYNKDIVSNNNDGSLSRTYQGYLFNANYRLTDTLQVGGNYTLSYLKGNFVGETSGSGPVTSGIHYYPEYLQPSWYAPKGYLSADQRQKLNLYVSWDAINSKMFTWNISFLERVYSGTPYGASSASVRVYGYVDDPGYQSPPYYNTYWFTNRDAYRTDNLYNTDLAMTFTFKVAGMELWVNGRVANVFNELHVVSPNTTVYVAANGRGLSYFDPFTDTPKECPQGSTSAQCKAAGANWLKGPNFGLPTSPSSYETPRTVYVAVGFRF